MNYKRLSIGLMAIFFQSCVEEFEPKIDSSESVPLVIDAQLRNDFTRQEIVIKKAANSSGVGQGSITNAQVKVVDTKGNTFEFDHDNNGRYYSSFTPEFNVGYTLEVNWEENEFKSSQEEMVPIAPIDSIYTSFGYVEVQSETGEVSKVALVDVLIDLKIEGREYYSRFDWQSTYEIQTPRQGTEDCWEGGNPGDPVGAGELCYMDESSSNFLRTFSSESISASVFQNYKVYSFDPLKRLQRKYSPLITQFSLSKRVHAYWEDLENQIENGGSIFDQPPTALPSNIQNSANGNIQVVGLFSVSAVESKRAFILPSAAPISIDHYDTECDFSTGPTGEVRLPQPYCCDCSLMINAFTNKPDFWDE